MQIEQERQQLQTAAGGTVPQAGAGKTKDFQGSMRLANEAMSNDEIAPCLSVVMPVYNEAATVEQVIRTVLAQRPVQELIVVDDCSADGTWEVLQKVEREMKGVRVIRHEKNQGKGAALRTG